MAPIAVVGLGGHAIMPKGERPSIGRQFHHARQAMRRLLRLVLDGWSLVITHGNGPQVGHILIRSDAARGRAYPIPLSVAVAESEGEIGYVIQQSLYNELSAAGIHRPIVTVLTQVLVDGADPAFERPTKPVGPYYTDAEAAGLRRRRVPLAHEPGAGWRQVVPSPRPVRIVEAETVGRLVEHDVIVIAAGGGGIPVREIDGRLEGVDAVIDKDLASAVLAEGIGADLLLLLTDVRKVSLNYGLHNQTDLEAMSVAETEVYRAAGHFPPGSMGPKVEGAVQFVRATGAEAIITTPGALARARARRDGTRIVP